MTIKTKEEITLISVLNPFSYIALFQTGHNTELEYSHAQSFISLVTAPEKILED